MICPNCALAELTTISDLKDSCVLEALVVTIIDSQENEDHIHLPNLELLDMDKFWDLLQPARAYLEETLDR